MKKSFKFIFFGAGPNQYPFIRYSNKKKNYNIVIHNKKDFKAKKYSDEFIYGSVYKKKNINNLLKKIKKKENLDDIVCRSSGPSIISAYKANKYFGLSRVSKTLASCVYSKFYLHKFLKKNKIPSIKSNILNKNNKKKYSGIWIIKPDSPIIGKKFVFKFENQVINKKDFFAAKTASDNRMVNISQYVPGNDITAISFIQKKNKKKILLSLINEWNFFDNNKIDLSNSRSVVGISTPPLRLNKKTLIKIKEIFNKILKLFPDYYGLFAASLRVNKNHIFAYEINLNIDANYSKVIFPNLYSQKSIYNLEIDNLMEKNLGKLKYSSNNKFVGILNKILIKDKIKYLNKIQEYEKKI